MKSSWRLLAVAIILGLVSVIALNYYLHSARSGAIDKTDQQEVVVAKMTIPQHSKITGDMLESRALPAGAVHPDALTSSTAAVGGIARTEIIEGEQLLAGRIFTGGSRATLSYRIPENMRAIAIPVNEVTGIGGYLSAGDRVDLLVTYETIEITDSTVTYTVFQDIAVLAAGDSPLEQETQEKRVGATVTLAVTPAQAEVIAFAYLNGTFHLALRSPGDNLKVNLDHYGPDNFAGFRER